MKRKNTQSIGEVLKGFFEDNTELYEKMLETRVKRGWGEILGPMIQQYTQNIYVKNHVLHVSLTSSVLRSELILNREKIVKSLNEYAGASVIRDIVIR
jgi:F0F1-type ATP synthase delta subunit